MPTETGVPGTTEERPCWCPSGAPQEETWDLGQERQFLENLLCQRFNFLLVFYSLIVSAAFTTEIWRNCLAVLLLGGGLCFCAALPIARAQYRLDLILNHLEGRKGRAWVESCVLVKWDLDGGGRTAPRVMRTAVGSSRRRWVGYWLPLVCWTSLLLCAALTYFNLIGPVRPW